MNNFFSKKGFSSICAILISIFCYLMVTYLIDRSSFYLLFILYTGLFSTFLFFVYKSELNEKTLLSFSFVFRTLLLFSIPNLSDDFYRFIWDGRMIWNGLNPYLFLPETDTSLVAEGQKLYDGMGPMNGSHYTCYPPLNQFSFLIPAIFFSKKFIGSIVVMRLMLIAADFGTYFFGKKILAYLNLPSKHIFLYLLNPFIILEVTGNLHFEGLMILFLAISMCYLLKNQHLYSAVAFSFSVSVKLIPLLLLPVFFRKLGIKKTVVYTVLVLLLNCLFFLPFVSLDLYDNFMKSIHLYFQNFEFNASLYYVIREIGFSVKGYNIIGSVGKVTPIIIFTLVSIMSLFRDNKNSKTLFETMLFSICIYYALASIVHPWYIALPLFFSVFTRYRFPLVWTFVVFLSYAAYQNEIYRENLYFVALEYTIVFAVLFYELFYAKNNRVSFFFKKTQTLE